MKYIGSMGISFKRAVDELRAGHALAFPTDTVWGLGVAVGFCPSPASLFAAKKRPAGKPVAWLVGSVDDLTKYGQDIPDYALQLARENWPGALTLVVRASERVGEPWRSDAGTVGLRMPDSDATLRLIREVGCPLATTSANLSGQPAVPASEPFGCELATALRVKVLEAGTGGAPSAGDPANMAGETGAMDEASNTGATSTDAGAGAASTVIDCTAGAPRILRQGPVSGRAS